MQRGHGGRSSATPERTFPGLRAGAGLAELASPFAGMRLSKKVLKKCIDIENRNLVSPAPGSEQTKDFYPVGSLSARTLVTTKTNETPGEKEHTIHVSTQSTQNVSLMRTRSGSLAAVPARVPSHPAYAGVLCALPQVQAAQIHAPAPDTPALLQSEP